VRVDRTLAVDRVAQRVDHAAQHFGADRYFQDASGGLGRVAFRQMLVFAEHHRAD